MEENWRRPGNSSIDQKARKPVASGEGKKGGKKDRKNREGGENGKGQKKNTGQKKSIGTNVRSTVSIINHCDRPGANFNVDVRSITGLRTSNQSIDQSQLM